MWTQRMIALALIAALAVTGLTLAPAMALTADRPVAEVNQDAPATLAGIIASLDLPNNKFTVKHGEDQKEQTEFTVSDSTSYMLDGQKSTKEAVLKVDANVRVVHKNNAAILVKATSAQPPQ